MTSRYRSGRRIARASISLSWAMLMICALMTTLVVAVGMLGRTEMIISLLPAMLLLLPAVLPGCLTAMLAGHAAMAVFDIAERP